MTATIENPADLAPDLVNCTDCDAHEMIPTPMWGEAFGDAGQRFIDICTNMDLLSEGGSGENAVARSDIEADDAAITEENVWGVRGATAPSAIDLTRRADVLDLMGVDKQLIYPTFGMCGLILTYNPLAHTWFGYDPDEIDRLETGHGILDAHNDWCMRIAREMGHSRVRPVAVIRTDSVPQMLEDAEKLLAGGVRAVMIPNGVPPAGLSPADAALDPFWKMLADANVPVTFHIGTEFALLASPAWSMNVPLFESSQASSVEFPIQPHWGATLNLSSENYLAAMILGGVLERHPHLRVGSIEVGAHWIGPLAERLDSWAGEFRKRLDPVLSLKPSEYINRQVRVTPFVFEDVGFYFERYPQIADSYCFSTDYPHKEGGKYSKLTFRKKLAHLGDDIAQKFFVDNGSLLLPD